MKKLIDLLEQLLASNYSFYLKSQNYHWNVESKNFIELHNFFGVIYRDLSETIDELAEHIRQLGFKVPASLEYFSKKSQILPGNHDETSIYMLDDINSDLEKLSKITQDTLLESQKIGDEVISDFLISLLKYYRKNIWLVKSISK